MNARGGRFARPAKPLRLMAAAIILPLMGVFIPVAAGAGAGSMPADGGIADSFKKQIAALAVAKPSERDPVSVASAVFPAQVRAGQRAVVVIKVRMQPGWRIYASVPPSEPYIPSRKRLELPAVLQAVGDWRSPPARPYAGHSKLLIYQGEQVFIREIQVAAGAAGNQALSAGLSYQACNREICLPPTKKINPLTLTIL